MYPSIAKAPSAPKLESKRKRSSQGIGKSGDKYNMSATADEKANKYLGDVDKKEPEKMKVTSQEGDMSTVEKSRSKSSDKGKSSKDRPRASSKFEFDTGWIDMGYEDRRESEKEKKEEGKTNEGKESPTDSEVQKNDDKSERSDDKSERTDEESQKKKKDVVVSAQSGITDYDSKTAIERSERFMRTDLGEKVRSSDESFQTGATYLRADMSRGDASLGSHIRRQWEVFSQRNSHEGAYDDVMPFHDFRQQKEQDKLNSLKDQQGAGGDKTSSQKAVTGVTNLKNQKDFMKRNFDKKFEHQLNDMKWNMRADNDILFFLKRLFVRNLEELKKLIVAASVVLNLPRDKRDALYKALKIVSSGQEQSREECLKLLEAKLREFLKEEVDAKGGNRDAGMSIADRGNIEESDIIDFAKRVLRTSSRRIIEYTDEIIEIVERALEDLFVRNLEELKKLVVAASVVLNLPKDKRDALYKAFKISSGGREQSREECLKLLESKFRELIEECDKGKDGYAGMSMADYGIIEENHVIDFAKRVLRISAKLAIVNSEEKGDGENERRIDGLLFEEEETEEYIPDGRFSLNDNGEKI